MYNDHDAESTNFGGMSPVQLAAIAATDFDPDTNGPPLLCPACGCRELRLIASGVHHGSVLSLTANDGMNVVRGVEEHATGAAVITLFAGACEHVVGEVTRVARGRVYRCWGLVSPALVAPAELVDFQGGAA